MQISLSTFLIKARQANPPILAEMAKPYTSLISIVGRTLAFCLLIAWSLFSFGLMNRLETNGDLENETDATGFTIVIFLPVALCWVW